MLSLNETIQEFNIQTDDILFSSKDYNNKNIVIFFFPKADTSGCTSEAIAFSNLQKQFDKENCVIIGISKDNPKKQSKFREKYNLSCLLGSDFESDLCEKFGVWIEKSMYGKKYMGIQRSTFLINTKRVISYVWPKVKVPGHAEEVLSIVKKLNN